MTSKISFEQIDDFFQNFETLENEEISKIINESFDDKAIERMAEHIEEFYGVQEDEEISVLLQMMLTGYLAAKQNLAN